MLGSIRTGWVRGGAGGRLWRFGRRRLAKKLWPIVIVIIFFAPAPSAFGESVSATTKVTLTILPVASISIADQGERGTTVYSIFSLPVPTSLDLERGYMEFPGALTLIVRSNTNWSVSVRTEGPIMGKSEAGAYKKPISEFWLRADGGSYRTIGNTDRTVAEGKPGVHTLSLDYRVFLNPDFEPGYYNLTLVYTILTH